MGRAVHERTVTFETGTASHAGLVRTQNEDGYLAQPDSGVWAVADGMGGHEAGKFASATVIKSLVSIGTPVSPSDLLARFEDRVLVANQYLKEVARERGHSVIGATVAALLIFDGYYACVWLGDSRIYLVRSGRIAQVSRDHTEVQELVEKGVLSREEARAWPGRNVITRAVGVHDAAELELAHGVLRHGDCFVICSDGLTNHVADDEILETATTREPQDACDELVALALQRGGTDNVTVIVVRCHVASEGGTTALRLQGAGGAAG
jgi:protein phosphatase